MAGTNHTKSRIAAASSLLIYVKSHRSETQRHASRSMQNGIEPSEIRPRRLKSRSPSYSPWERNNAQVDRYRRLRLYNGNLGTGHDACTDCSAGRHGDGDCRRMWPRQDQNKRRMRRTDHRTADPPRRPQVRAMECRRLRRVSVSRKAARLEDCRAAGRA